MKADAADKRSVHSVKPGRLHVARPVRQHWLLQLTSVKFTVVNGNGQNATGQDSAASFLLPPSDVPADKAGAFVEKLMLERQAREARQAEVRARIQSEAGCFELHVVKQYSQAGGWHLPNAMVPCPRGRSTVITTGSPDGSRRQGHPTAASAVPTAAVVAMSSLPARSLQLWRLLQIQSRCATVCRHQQRSGRDCSKCQSSGSQPNGQRWQ